MTAVDYERVPRLVDLSAEPELAPRLEKIWESRPGLIGWIASVDHKSICIRYLVTAFAFLLIGGVEALIMRVQLAGPNRTLLTPEQYNELFTLHGLTMIFLCALPVLSGFSNYLFPLVPGARDMAFPRLNAFSHWVYIASGLFMYASLLIAAAPNDGWFNYPPFSQKLYDPGLNIDFYALGMIFYGISTTVCAANFLVTFLRMRAPGMSIDRVPILTWGTVTISVGNLLAVPSVSLAFLLLWMDHQFDIWLHHMFATGIPFMALAFISGASFIITIPSAIGVFC